MSGPRLGRPSKKKTTKIEYTDNKDRIEVERFFSVSKRSSGMGLIVNRLSETTLTSIALSVLVTSLFATKTLDFFLFYLSNAAEETESASHFVIFEQVA